MFKKRLMFERGLLILVVFQLLTLISCGQESESGFPVSADSQSGRLELNISLQQLADSNSQVNISGTSNVVTRSILPSVDMEVAGFSVAGIGPDGAVFGEESEQSMIIVDDLVFGDWTIAVTALNVAGIPVGGGRGLVTVVVGQSRALDVVVSPQDGFGILNLALSWNGEDTQTPSIEAELIPFSGPAYVQNFDITTDGAANYDSNLDLDNFPTGVPTGYYTQVVKLMDGVDGVEQLVMGAVEIVRIAKDQTTSGSFIFEEINKGTGNIQVNIEMDMQEPLTVSISGQVDAIRQGDSMNLTAFIADSAPAYTGNVIYVWYINAVSRDTGETVTLGDDLPAGVYRVDVTAYSADGNRAGSASHTFQVEDWKLICPTPNCVPICLDCFIPSPYVQGEILVSFVDTMTDAQVEEFLNSDPEKFLGFEKRSNFYMVDVPVRSEKEIVAELDALSFVEYAQLNYIYYIGK